MEARDLVNDYKDAGLRVYVTGDGSDVYEDGVMKVAKSDDGVFQPTLILVGTRLGIDKVTPVYWEALKYSLQMTQSMGIAGYVDPYQSCSYTQLTKGLAGVPQLHIISWAHRVTTSSISTPTKRAASYLITRMSVHIHSRT